MREVVIFREPKNLSKPIIFVANREQFNWATVVSSKALWLVLVRHVSNEKAAVWKCGSKMLRIDIEVLEEGLASNIVYGFWMDSGARVQKI